MSITGLLERRKCILTIGRKLSRKIYIGIISFQYLNRNISYFIQRYLYFNQIYSIYFKYKYFCLNYKCLHCILNGVNIFLIRISVVQMMISASNSFNAAVKTMVCINRNICIWNGEFGIQNRDIHISIVKYRCEYEISIYLILKIPCIDVCI